MEQFIMYYAIVAVLWFIGVCLNIMHGFKWNVDLIAYASGSIFESALKVSLAWPLHFLFQIIYIFVAMFGDDNPPQLNVSSQNDESVGRNKDLE